MIYILSVDYLLILKFFFNILQNFFLLEAGDAMHQFYVEIFNKVSPLGKHSF